MADAERFKPMEPQCPTCKDPSTFVANVAASGELVSAWCAFCDRPVIEPGRPYYAHHLFDALTFAELKCLPVSGCAKCNRCGKMEKLERHHYGPRAVFGADCENWATGDLCRPCHEFWHLRMGQGIGSSSPPRNAREVLRSLSPIERLANLDDQDGERRG